MGLLEHSIHGKWTNGQVSGFHLLNRHSIGLVKWSETLPADSKGVWKGEFHFERNGKSASKISTMFPLNWSPTHLMFEAYSAFQEIDLNLEFVNQTTRTSSGIPVVMRLENQTVKTFYPLHQTDLEN